MRPLVAKPVTKASIMMMIGIFWLAIIFSLSAGQEIDSNSDLKEGGNGDTNSSRENRALEDGDDKLKVTIYYEALCYDSISFIKNQLGPSWKRRRDQMDLKLVPFGKAFIDDSNASEPVYYCQHGSKECDLNILHGCVLDKLRFERAFPVVLCLMQGFRTSFDQCIANDQAAKAKIQECARGKQGEKLFKRFSDETFRLSAHLPFVPAIEVDETYASYDQDRWLYRFDQSFRAKYADKFNETLE